MSELWNYDPDLDQPDQRIVDFDVVSEDGASVGKVSEAIDDEETAFLVVARGGPLSKKHIVVPAGLVKQINVDANKVFLRVDESVVADAPDHDHDWQSDPTWRERATGHFPQ